MWASYLLTPAAAWIAIFVVVASYAKQIFFNLYRHPLAHIPGPKLAAATYLYQTYYRSRYYLKIAQLHDEYGPVVRITPDEVHLSNPDNYDKINYVGTKYNKSARFYGAFPAEYATFNTSSNVLHRIRRNRLNPFFSRKMVFELEEVVQSTAEKLVNLVAKRFSENKSVDLHHALRAVSIDVITAYAFGNSYNLLDSPDIGLEFFAMIQETGKTFWFFIQWPWLQKLLVSIPKAITARLSPALKQTFSLKEHARKKVLAVKADMELGTKLDSKPTIFRTLLTPDETQGGAVPTAEQIADEALAVLAAAADTTGNSMTVATYNVVSSPLIYEKLTSELKTAFPDPQARLSFAELEKLPYLTAVLKEGLRLSFGVPGRLPRAVPDGGAVFDGYEIPAGSVVGLSSWVLHQNKDCFPDPTRFEPERWLNADSDQLKRMEKAFVPFGKGSRACVGMPLAYAELYVTIGTLFRRFHHLKSNILTAEDLVYEDYFSSYHPLTATFFQVSDGTKAEV